MQGHLCTKVLGEGGRCGLGARARWWWAPRRPFGRGREPRPVRVARMAASPCGGARPVERAFSVLFHHFPGGASWCCSCPGPSAADQPIVGRGECGADRTWLDAARTGGRPRARKFENIDLWSIGVSDASAITKPLTRRLHHFRCLSACVRALFICSFFAHRYSWKTRRDASRRWSSVIFFLGSDCQGCEWRVVPAIIDVSPILRHKSVLVRRSCASAVVVKIGGLGLHPRSRPDMHQDVSPRTAVHSLLPQAYSRQRALHRQDVSEGYPWAATSLPDAAFSAGM